MDNLLLIILLISFLYFLYKNNELNENFAVVYDGDNILTPTQPRIVNNLEECNPEIYDISEYNLVDDNGELILDEDGNPSITGYYCSMKPDKCPYVTKYKNQLICNDSKSYTAVPARKVKLNKDNLCSTMNRNYINVEQRYNPKTQTWDNVGRTKRYCITSGLK